MEWIWNYVFALLTSHSITQMDSCRHGCWAKLVTLSPNNIAITKSHTNYGHIGIFIGAWAWQPKQCPLRERAESLGPVLVPHNGLSSDMTIKGAGKGYGPPGSPPSPPALACVCCHPTMLNPDKCPIIFTAVLTIWYESHSTGQASIECGKSNGKLSVILSTPREG